MCVLTVDSSLVNWRKPDSRILKINSPGAMWQQVLGSVCTTVYIKLFRLAVQEHNLLSGSWWAKKNLGVIGN